MTTEDAVLRAAWQRLEARRAPGDAALLPVEEIAALAASNAEDDARAAQLDLVLAHPVMAAEYALLRDVVDARRKATAPVRRLSPAWLAAAAAVVLVAGAGLLLPRTSEDPMRSGGAAVVLVTPDDAADGATFIWRAYADAVSYRFEVVDAEGAVLAERETTDTSLVLPAPLATAGVWRVTALLPDGQQVASPARRVQPTP